ncbi:MAG TPA: helix-turn-helix domain-containing protein [Pseudonocardiaceae bacterium]
MSTTGRGRELTVREAAQRVHRAEETIRRWIWSAKLPARKLGTGYQVQETDLDAVAAGVPAPREPSEPGPSVGDWVAAVKAWRGGNDVAPRGGAGQLVIEDRAARSGLGDR